MVSAMLRLVPYVVCVLVLAGIAVVGSYFWNMPIAESILTDQCGFDYLGPGPVPTMTWLGCSE